MTQHIRCTTPVMNTARLHMRGLQLHDAPLLKLFAGDLRVSRHLAVVPYPYPDGAAEGFIAASMAHEGAGLNWAITLQGGAELIGVIGLADKVEGLGLGYWLAPQFWGAGLMGEAVAAVVTCCRAGGVPHLSASAHQDNPASARVLQRAGFVWEGAGQEYCLAQNSMVDSDKFRLNLE